MESEAALKLQIEDVNRELAELRDTLDKDTLYTIPTILYHEPREAPGFTELVASLRSFEPRLRSFVQTRRAERYAAEQRRSVEFMQKYQAWVNKLRKVEAFDPPLPAPSPPLNDPIVPPSTNAPLSGRNSRRTGGGDVVRSEAEMNQILLSLLEQERDNPATRWMATLAVTPQMRAADPKQIFEDVFIDFNGQLPQNYYQECPSRQGGQEEGLVETEDGTIAHSEVIVHVNGAVVWTEAEQRVFVDKFLAYPKNFRKIASYLPFKRTADCVAFYYRNKKRLKLKQLRRMMLSENSLNKVKIPRKPTSGLGGPGRPPKKPRGRPGRPPKHPKPIISEAEDETEPDTETQYDSDSDGISSNAASLLSLSAVLSPDSPSGRNEKQKIPTSDTEKAFISETEHTLISGAERAFISETEQAFSYETGSAFISEPEKASTSETEKVSALETEVELDTAEATMEEIDSRER